VVQRAAGARVVVDGCTVAEFDGPGLVVFVGVTHDDSAARAGRLAGKIHDLRLFEPRHSPVPIEDGRRELSASELGLPVIVVSQFTLYGDARKGRRPTWTAAAPGPVAEPLVDAVVAELRARGANASSGIFGADMAVQLTNDGPFTILLDVDGD
jgi:D-tyrosyl-tRNA(Tyr) deacylase